ncbi:hypothetical protein [Paenibacillus paeoniae]|uniref:Uncharacterized protein n=1 Tax=Paenibacillus paeoniae TaxID=2292705 RepID=A0A371PIL4_9BACL|nr:hypothetical protein [Paenibacillus paeoniae]REK75745.1 hypothetical protein DX130_01300 [Paenibacillus paeoniae]
METIELTALIIGYAQHSDYKLHFSHAVLVIVTDYGDKLWYIDVDGVTDHALLSWFGQSEDIRVELTAKSRSGEEYQGTAYFHPNEPSLAAAIRGDGELRRIQP